MAIRIKARIKPNVTLIPRLQPNNDPNGTNMAECAENATELPEFATKSLDFGQVWTRIIAELKRKHDFPGGIWVCSSCFPTYSAVFCPVLGWRFNWILGAIRGRFGSIWLDISGRSSPYDTTKPESA